MTLVEELAGWASALELDAVPARVRAMACSLVLSQLAAARATLGHDLGRRVVRAFGPPLQDDPKRTAYTLAALTIALDFDDTVYAGHVTHAAVNVPLAYGRARRLGGAALLAATVAAIESAARVTAAATLGPFRGQTAGHSHLVGAVAGRLHAERAPAQRWVDALGIALAAPPWPLMRGFMGSDAKLLTAATPLRAGLDACDAAAAGLRGAADILEARDGFLAAFAQVPLPEAAVAGLGRRWHTETASLKIYPGSAYIDGAVDCAVELHARHGALDPDDVEVVDVEASVFTAELERRFAAFLDGPESSPVALGFSVSYNVATALLTGALTPDDLSAERIGDKRRWALARKVRVEQDAGLTMRAVRATAPVGEALRAAGERAIPWLESIGGAAATPLAGRMGAPAETFEQADKAMGAKLTVRLRSGRELRAEREIAVGAAGDETHGQHFDLMRSKFASTGGPGAVADAVERLEELAPSEVDELIAAAFADVA